MEEKDKKKEPAMDLPDYERPTMTEMNQDDVLATFQMTASEISSAGCWWGSCPP